MFRVQHLLKRKHFFITKNILDKTVVFVFDFIIDVLNACGVNINDVIGYLLREIYDVEVNINGGIEAFYQSVADGTIDINVQSEFLGK